MAFLAAGCACSGGILGIDPTLTTEATITTVASTSSSSSPTTTAAPAPLDSTTSSSLPPEPTTTIPLPAGNVGCPADASGCLENTAAGGAYLEANTEGAPYGFHFVRIGGGVVGSLNPDEPFYPASSLKVLQHLHAVRWVAAQPDQAAALGTSLIVYDDTCADAGASWTQSLSSVLTAMMIESANKASNAVQSFFGREAINATATDVVGTTNTLLAHHFGCGGPSSNPANRSTARDLSLIYERAGSRAVVDEAGFDLFASFMLGPVWPTLEAAVREEGAAAGLDDAEIGAFLGETDLLYKAGWWDYYLIVGGYLALPGCSGPREYAFAVFLNGADWVSPGFDISDVVAVVLRSDVRAALEEAADPAC